jgi:hypothetical protein
MESKPKNLGRAYLVGKLRKRGLSRRDAVRIAEMPLEIQGHSCDPVRAALIGRLRQLLVVTAVLDE